MRTSKTELVNANKVLEKHLGKIDDICKIVDAIYVMRMTIEKRMELNEKGKEP